MNELSAAYQSAPLEPAHLRASRAVETSEDAALTDEEIDLFLRSRCRRATNKPAAT